MTTPSDPMAIAIAGEAFATLGRALRPAAERYLAVAFGPDWRVRSGLLTEAGADSAMNSLDDPGHLLNQLVRRETWTFIAPALSADGRDRSTRAALHSLIELRNRWAHFRSFEARDCVRVIADVRSILVAFGGLDPEAAQELELLESRAVAQMNAGGQGDLTELRAAYAESVLAATSHIDLDGISPMADARMLRVSLPDLFVIPEIGKPDDPDVDAETNQILQEMFGPMDDDLFRSRPRLAVVGSPGAGKSTLLKSVARRAILEIDAERVTPVLLRANQLFNSMQLEPGLTLRRYLTHRWSDRFGPLIEQDIRGGSAWLLIDGLDEVPDARSRAAVALTIDRYCADVPDGRVWVTSRPIGFTLGPASARFEVAEVKPFGDDRIRLFAERWVALRHDGLEPETDLADEILASPALTDLARTPLLLTILALLWQRGTRLPERRVSLYQIATDTLLRDWPFHRQGTEIDQPTVMEILQAVAFRLIESDYDFIREGDLVPLAAAAITRQDGSPAPEARRSARRLLRTLEETTGFFIADGRDVEGSIFRFIHRTFAEYLAARALLDGWADGSLELERFLHRPEWATTVGLLFEYASEVGPGIATKLLSAVVGVDQPLERHLHGNLRLCLRALAAGVRVRAELRDDILTRGLATYLGPLDETKSVALAAELAVSLRRSGSRSTVGLKGQPSDSPATRARKIGLRFMADPSDPNLAELIDAARDSNSGVSSPVDRLGLILRPLIPAPYEFTGTILAIPSRMQAWIPPVSVQRFARLGLPLISVQEMLADASSILEGALISVDPAELTVEDLLAAHLPSSPWWLGPMLVEVQPWHDVNREAIEALTAKARTLPAGLAWFAARCYLEAPEDGAQAWLPVLLSMLMTGDRAAFRSAWSAILAYAREDETFERISDEAAGLIPTRRPDMLQTFIEGLAAAEIWTPAYDEALRDLVSAENPTVRGMARRVLAAHRSDASVLGLLAESDAFEPIFTDEGILSDAEPNATEGLIDSLLAIDVPGAGPDIQGGVDRALERVFLRAPMAENPLHSGPGAHPVADALARTAALSDRPEARSWAAYLLCVTERESAASELEVLLSDPVAEVRAIAAAAVGPEDLEEFDWLVRALPSFLRNGTTHAAGGLAQVLRDEVEPYPHPDLVHMIEGLLDLEPANQAALSFASVYLLYESPLLIPLTELLP